jgi:hypothetical protein
MILMVVIGMYLCVLQRSGGLVAGNYGMMGEGTSYNPDFRLFNAKFCQSNQN